MLYRKRFLFAFLFLLATCGKKQTYTAIEDKVVSPVDAVASQNGENFYLLNADLSRKHNQGSLIVLDKEGNKKKTVLLPRLGRNLALADSDLLVTFDGETGKNSSAKAILFDVSDPENPEQKKEWSLGDCSPLNAVLRSGYDYFAIACSTGELYLGEKGARREDSTLEVVRQYPGYIRRALHIDTKRELLFAFVSDMGEPGRSDQKYTDKTIFDEETLASSEGEDEVPDFITGSKSRRRDLKERSSPFQFAVLDLKEVVAEKKDGKFVKKDFSEVRHEMRWMYFDLTNFDGTPDDASRFGGLAENSTIKYYRTNFWHAQADPDDSDVFYLSHRGQTRRNVANHANNIVRIQIKGDPRATKQEDGKYSIPKTKEFFEFKRVFGFKGEQSHKDNYLSQFVVGKVEGQKILLVNSFRDLVHFENPRYAIYAAGLDGSSWWDVTTSTSYKNSFYQVALGSNGRLLSVSFYDNSAVLMQMTVGGGFNLLKTIK